MTPEQADHARALLHAHFPTDGRAASRSEMTVTKLARAIGRDKSYLSDFLNHKKQSLGAGEVQKIEDALGLQRGDLIGAADLSQKPLREVRSVPLGQEFGDDPEPDHDDLAEVAGRSANKRLEPGEVPERNVVAGLGKGGVAPGVLVDGKVLDGVRAVWRLPVDYLRTELRAREADVDFIAVEGDSMIPTLLPGDRVMINRSQTAPSPDGLFAIFDGIGIAVKRLEIVKGSNPVRIRIKSDNPAHGCDEIAADDLNVLGRVICKVTRL